MTRERLGHYKRIKARLLELRHYESAMLEDGHSNASVVEVDKALASLHIMLETGRSLIGALESCKDERHDTLIATAEKIFGSGK
jgi:hypothetical protein